MDLDSIGMEVNRVVLARLLGYTSIGFWLCAQFPQVLKNAKLKSCEGLALPFLINWLFGDITNLLGCLLTDQLPFQTYLASYFCVIDIALVSQYFYYQSTPPPTPVHTRSLTHPPTTRRPRYSRFSSSLPESPNTSYQAIYEAALEVARAAERASGRSRSRRRLDSGRPSRAPSHGDPTSMMESFHSELSASTEMSEGSNGRGRSMQRTQVEPVQDPRSKSRSISMVRGSGGRGKGRRAAGVAFMSFGLLGMVRFGSTNSLTRPDYSGRVIPWTPPTPPPTLYPYPTLYTMIEPPHPPENPSFERVVGRISAWTCTTLYLTSRLPQIWKNFTRKSVEGLSILLFIFAFCGNIAYVLSILLNPSGGSDPSETNHYLLEALPYLLGSGGTLLFDLTIMIQSLIYGSAPPILTTRRLFRKRHRHPEDGLASTERQPLLQGRARSTSEGGISPVRIR